MPNPTPFPEEQVIPQPKPNRLWLTILIIVLATAVVVGLVIYFVMANQKQDLEQQIKELQQTGQLPDTGSKTQEQRETEVDSDNDGLTDSRELQIGSDPNNPDTDNDGYLDGNEVANGYNPLVNEKAQVESANWQTYTNTKYGYEIKYPENYFLSDRSTAESVNFDTEGPGSGLSIEIIEELFVNRMEELTDGGWQDKGTKVFNNVTWNILYAEGSEQVSGMWYKSIRELGSENKIIEVTLNRSGTEQIFNQILSTFKFLDNRILLTPENISQYNDPSKDISSCHEEFDFSSANTTVTYYNSYKGISIDIPYNSNWGSEKYRINPYDEYSSGVHFGLEKYNSWINFGAIGVFEGCSWVRSYVLGFLPAKSSDAVITEMPEKDWMSIKPYKSMINGLEIVKYEEVGMCGYPSIIVIGKKYNYELRPICGVDTDKEFDYLESIIKTIKFLE